MQGRAKEVVNALTEKVIDLMKKHGSQWTKPFANQNFISVRDLFSASFSAFSLACLCFKTYSGTIKVIVYLF